MLPPASYHYPHYLKIKMLAKCTRKNGNTPPRVARCGIFSFSPLQPSLFLEKQHAPRSDWREFLPLSCQTCEAFPEALFWNSSWHQSDSPFFSAWHFRKLIYDLENGSWQMYLLWLHFIFSLSFFLVGGLGPWGCGGGGGVYDFVTKEHKI